MTSTNEMVINFHMTEACNYRCGYCYATWEGNDSQSELHHSSQDIQSLLKKLADYFFADNPIRKALGYTSVRLNFAGGEPVMLGGRFIEAVLLAKKLGFRTSIITNGHLLSAKIMSRIAPHLDMLGLSFDTADLLIAQSIGRVDRKSSWFSPSRVIEVVAAYRSLNNQGKVKINTVVNAFNWREDMCNLINQIKPDKWKLLRVLPVYSHQLTISYDQYRKYIERHKTFSEIVSLEDNQDMWQSYLMHNLEGRFYQNSNACQGVVQSPSILDVGVDKAIAHVAFNTETFSKRYQTHDSTLPYT
ncbi:viperin family antiviral radical SAM protein [Shewanella goraebulensis]|uniref:viperin family antiviral radical SAM protein n=1 Tax=Shewanella goraebulensis TaxID=3050637 RepID=UPI00254D2006|nr:viperin family antiviral radical SAM protein [Shewanella goraebulensis]